VLIAPDAAGASPPTGDPTVPAERSPRAGIGRFLARRLLRLAVLLAAVSTISFALVQASPIDPVDAYIGADVAVVGPEQRALIAERWGLDEPPVERFLAWAGQLLRGNLGESTVYGEPVAQVIGERFLTSLPLMAVAWLLSGALGFAAGLLAGSRPGSWWDRAVSWSSYTLASTPTFWFGLLLLTVFAVQLGVAPVCCAVPIGSLPDEVTLLDRAHHLVLPAITLSIVGIPPIAMHTRQATIAARGSDHVTFARAQGEHGTGLLLHRVLRSAAAPALLLQFASLAELFGGAVLAEQVFTYPGLGEATATAALRQDVPLLLGIVLFATVFVFVGNLVGDLLHARLDRRVRLDGAGAP
jgi:peptide/nickel transport system permease protein